MVHDLWMVVVPSKPFSVLLSWSPICDRLLQWPTVVMVHGCKSPPFQPYSCSVLKLLLQSAQQFPMSTRAFLSSSEND